jgi:hypothetical protein
MERMTMQTSLVNFSTEPTIGTKTSTKVDCPQVIYSSPTTKRIIKQIYSPNQGTKELCVGKQMTYENLRYSTLTGTILITGRALHPMAQTTFRYGKKALAYAHGFLDSSKKLPSGKRIDDLLNHILDEIMYKEESEAKNKMVIIDQEDSSALVKITMLNPLSLQNVRMIGCLQDTLLFVCMDAQFSLKKMIVLLTLQQG